MIEIRNVMKEYPTGGDPVRALKGISLTIADGEFISIAGPSGSGKSTLLNLLGCLDTATSGDIIHNGRAVAGLKRDELAVVRRETLGFIFQSYNLIPVLSALENVALALDLMGLPDAEVKTRSKAALAEVGLEGMENRLPGKLSGGQQQRVAVARALVKNPSVVLADEPTANLDSKTGEDILKLMLTLNISKGTTFVFSTHDKMVMDYARRLVLLHDGMIANDERRT